MVPVLYDLHSLRLLGGLILPRLHHCEV